MSNQDDMLMQQINKKVYNNIGGYSMKSVTFEDKYTKSVGIFLIAFAIVFLPAAYVISVDNLPKFLKTKDENDKEKVNILNTVILSLIVASVALLLSYNLHK
jgi:hypothetical protein